MKHLLIFTIILLGGCSQNKVNKNKPENNLILKIEDDKVLEQTSEQKDEQEQKKIREQSQGMRQEFYAKQLEKDIQWNNGINLQIDCHYILNNFSTIYVKKRPESLDIINCDSILYINNSEFEKCESRCRLLSIEFDNLITKITINGKTITKKTNSHNLSQMFEECETLNEINYGEDGREYKGCLVWSKKQDLGLSIILLDDIISKIYIYEPS